MHTSCARSHVFLAGFCGRQFALSERGLGKKDSHESRPGEHATYKHARMLERNTQNMSIRSYSHGSRDDDEIPDHLKKIKVVVPKAKDAHASLASSGKRKFKFLPAKDVRRALGVDYGRRHIGVAVSNLGLAPRPLQFIRGGGIVELMRMAQDVVDVAVAEQCDSIVIGLPVTLDGSLYKRATDSQQGRRCRNFAHTVFSLSEKHSLGVFLVDERGTSQEAGALLDILGSRQPAKGRKDSVAAALILSTFFADPSAALRVRTR